MKLRGIAWRAIAASLLIAGATPVLADVIDGDWCATDSRHFSIAGPSITTPAGTHTTGNYSRHAFSYVVPDSDPGAGTTIRMQLLNEETVRVFIEGQDPEIWNRCQLNS
jgi:hypothetical protein